MTILSCRTHFLLITHVFEMNYSISLRPPLNLRRGVHLHHQYSIFKKGNIENLMAGFGIFALGIIFDEIEHRECVGTTSLEKLCTTP